MSVFGRLRIIITCFQFPGLLVNIKMISLIIILIRSYMPVVFYSFTKCYNMNILCDTQCSLFCQPRLRSYYAYLIDEEFKAQKRVIFV